MRREIKFRVWDLGRARWLAEDESSLHCFTKYFLTFRGDIVGYDGAIESPELLSAADLNHLGFDTPGKITVTKAKDRFIVGQFTGMKDKNGREIYEDDYVMGFGQTFLVCWGIVRRKIVNNDGGMYEIDIPGFYFESPAAERLFPIVHNYKGEHDLQTLEVVGNKFEHPRLFYEPGIITTQC